MEQDLREREDIEQRKAIERIRLAVMCDEHDPLRRVVERVVEVANKAARLDLATAEIWEKEDLIARVERLTEENRSLRREVIKYKREVELTSKMLAHQTDLAREAELDREKMQRKLAGLRASLRRNPVWFDLDVFEEEHREWANKNFGYDRDWRDPLMGLVEEVGELHHALLKQKQGIRGSHEKHELDAMDAVGDIVIYLQDLCNIRGWRLSEILRDTWESVKRRDWKTNPRDGVARDES